MTLTTPAHSPYDAPLPGRLTPTPPADEEPFVVRPGLGAEDAFLDGTLEPAPERVAAPMPPLPALAGALALAATMWAGVAAVTLIAAGIAVLSQDPAPAVAPPTVRVAVATPVEAEEAELIDEGVAPRRVVRRTYRAPAAGHAAPRVFARSGTDPEGARERRDARRARRAQVAAAR